MSDESDNSSLVTQHSSLITMKIVLGVSGGIAAYKAPELVRRLKDAGADIRVILTPNAARFVSPLSLAPVSEHGLIVEQMGLPEPGGVQKPGPDSRLVRHDREPEVERAEELERVERAGHELEVLDAREVADVDVDRAVAVEEDEAAGRGHRPRAGRENALLTRRSRSFGSGSPDASHIFGNIEIGVKPGSEFSSFR